ncbi:hypothetical protein HY491_02380 [Candidatus Woesearchaeota archaeon]|nr:hypothetical protein [Candidatus Woesearchaeota archaeon]
MLYKLAVILYLLASAATAQQIPAAPSASAYLDTILTHVPLEKARVEQEYQKLLTDAMQLPDSTKNKAVAAVHEWHERSMRLLTGIDQLLTALRQVTSEDSLFWALDKFMGSIETQLNDPVFRRSPLPDAGTGSTP